MRRTDIISAFCCCMLFTLVSCNNGNSNGGTKFQPKERESKFASDAEREAAIAQKRNDMYLNAETLLLAHDVKMSVIPPAPQGDEITQDIAEQIAFKMLEITCANGIGGLNNSPIFAFTAKMQQTGREATGTAPQKMIVQYSITYTVMNMLTGDVYATASQDVIGVGSSFEEANSNVAQSIVNATQVQQMLATASDKIIAWFNDNLQTFKNQVEKAEVQQDYALALAYVETVPEKAQDAFAYATEKQQTLLPKFMHKIATQELAAMQAAITAANGVYTPEVAAHLSLIPVDAPEHKQAKALYEKFEKQIDARAKSDEEKRIAAEQREHEHKLAQMNAEIKKAKYEADAVKKQNREMDYYRDGFWGSLGKRIMGGIDYATDVVSEAMED